MGQPTIPTRIIEELRRSHAPLDDDELAARLNVRPRQSINQACRALEQGGRLRRYKGPAGKIVNDLRRDTGTATTTAAPIPRLSGPTDIASGDSAAQRQAELVMLELLSARLGVRLAPRRFEYPGGIRVEVDGADERPTVLVEAWAHQGPPKSAQKHKVLADTLRLLYVASTLPVAPRLLLCLSDPAAAHHFIQARSWAAVALREFAVEVEVVALPDDVRSAVIAAQERQDRQ